LVALVTFELRTEKRAAVSLPKKKQKESIQSWGFGFHGSILKIMRLQKFQQLRAPQKFQPSQTKNEFL